MISLSIYAQSTVIDPYERCKNYRRMWGRVSPDAKWRLAGCFPEWYIENRKTGRGRKIKLSRKAMQKMFGKVPYAFSTSNDLWLASSKGWLSLVRTQNGIYAIKVLAQKGVVLESLNLKYPKGTRMWRDNPRSRFITVLPNQRVLVLANAMFDIPIPGIKMYYLFDFAFKSNSIPSFTLNAPEGKHFVEENIPLYSPKFNKIAWLLSEDKDRNQISLYLSGVKGEDIRFVATLPGVSEGYQLIHWSDSTFYFTGGHGKNIRSITVQGLPQ
jgi:hypothetical protein